MKAAANLPQTLGWQKGIPDSDYHGVEYRHYLSSTGLRTLINKSPAHFRAALAQPTIDTPALLLGKAVHCRILEPDRFENDFAVLPNIDKRTKAGRELFDDFTAQHPGAALITETDYEIIEGMAAAVEAHPMSERLFHGGTAEVSGLAVDPETEVPVRIRPDYLRENSNIILDLKSTTDASPEGFARSVHRFGYYVQTAMYLSVAELISGESGWRFVLVAVEKTPPFAVGVYELDPSALELGLRQYRSGLRQYANCLASGHWPGYSDQLQTLSLPTWAFNISIEHI